MLGLTLGVCASARCCGNAGEVGYQWKGNVLMMLKVGLKHNIISNKQSPDCSPQICLSVCWTRSGFLSKWQRKGLTCC